MMGQGGMMGRGMGPMGGPVMMRIIFALMDSDGDGTVSLQEFQAAHERIFKGMERPEQRWPRLTLEQIQAFMQGTRRSIPQQ
jgi:EF hand